MRPAYSVIFLTTLIGAGQGLFIALYAAQAGAALGFFPPAAQRFFVVGASACVALASLGLLASFFHLGRPERAWRAAAMWRTSWLSREVIALPVFMAAVTAWGTAHDRGWGGSLALGAFALAACLALFVCTAMIYAGVKFLQEWASPWTLPNFVLIGSASGFMLAVPLAAALAPPLASPAAAGAAALTLAALAARIASLRRNERVRAKSTPQSAIGMRGRIEQKSQGFTGGSFNTREFFHGASPATLRAVRRSFLLLGFVVPLVLVLIGARADSFILVALAAAVQYAGLVAERWYFLAQASHPQNLYYQCSS